jgi:hypothetical protein
MAPIIVLFPIVFFQYFKRSLKALSSINKLFEIFCQLEADVVIFYFWLFLTGKVV